MSKKTRVVIPARFSFVNVWEPRSINGGDPRYSISVIIPKNDKATINKVLRAIEEAKKEGAARFGGRVPANLKIPVKDGDIERPGDPGYKDSYFINASSYEPPQVVDARVQPILNRSEVYSGCYGKVSLNFYAYSNKANGSRGIAAGLGNVQKLREGEPLGRSSAEDDFEVEDEVLNH